MKTFTPLIAATRLRAIKSFFTKASDVLSKAMVVCVLIAFNIYSVSGEDCTIWDASTTSISNSNAGCSDGSLTVFVTDDVWTVVKFSIDGGEYTGDVTYYYPFTGLAPGNHTIDMHETWYIGGGTKCDESATYYVSEITGLYFVYQDADGDGSGNPNTSAYFTCIPSGWSEYAGDCNDNNYAIHPGATEICNGIDDNCNNLIDDGLTFLTYYVDVDQDSYGNASVYTQACSQPLGYVASSTNCNDANANIHLGATEICNGIDDNCNGLIDDGLTFLTYYADVDQDSYGNASVYTQACSQPSGYIANSTDCNDANANIHLGTAEVCNGIDDNCDGLIDNFLPTGSIMLYLPFDGNANDASGRGHNGTLLNSTLTTDRSAIDNEAYSFNGSNSRIDVADHSDLRPFNLTLSLWFYYSTPPSGTQVLAAKSLCQGTLESFALYISGNINAAWRGEQGGTQLAGPTLSSDQWHMATLTFDGVHNVASLYVDGSIANSVSSSKILMYDASPFIVGAELENCNPAFYFSGKIDEVLLLNYAMNQSDITGLYQSSSYSQAPTETVNGVDNDCDGLVDECNKWTGLSHTDENKGCNDGSVTVNYSSPTSSTTKEAAQAAHSKGGGSRDQYWISLFDSSGTLLQKLDAFPGNTVSVFNNLSGGQYTVKFEVGAENGSISCTSSMPVLINSIPGNTIGYVDSDNDGYGVPEISYAYFSCIPAGWSANYDDCDDQNNLRNPGLSEICDNLDDDCDGLVDANDPSLDHATLSLYYYDGDADGYGTNFLALLSCNAPQNYVDNAADCNDGNAVVNPGANEICNSIDDNCNGLTDIVDPSLDFSTVPPWYVDVDQDGYGNSSNIVFACIQPFGFVSDSTDCDNNNAAINPAAIEIIYDGIDNNCNGFVDENRNTALKFDGVDDYVNVAHNTALSPTQLTLECWVMRTSNHKQGGLVTKEPVESSTEIGYGLRINETYFCFNIGREGYGATAYSNTRANQGKWYHLAGTFDGTTLKIYVNGILKGTATTALVINSTADLKIGILNSLKEHFNGIIDEVRVWNIVRTQAEIQASMNQSICSSMNGLMANFPLDQGIAGGLNAGIDTADDISGNGNNGALKNFALMGEASNWVAGAPIEICLNLRACIPPTGLTSDQVTSTSAHLSWNNIPGAVSYKVKYKTANDHRWTTIDNISTNSFNLSGLTPSKMYYCMVKGICGPDPNISSEWSSQKSFTTSAFRLANEQALSLELYPNPVSENFTLDLQLNSIEDQSVDIFLLNALGQIIYTSHEVVSGELKKEITMPSSASSGWYIVRVVLNDQVMEKKLLYQK